MNHSLPQSIQQWLTDINKDGKSIHTQQAYKRGIRHFLDWYESVYEAEFLANSVMARDIRDWQAHQQQIEQSATCHRQSTLKRRQTIFQMGATARGHYC